MVTERVVLALPHAGEVDYSPEQYPWRKHCDTTQEWTTPAFANDLRVVELSQQVFESHGKHRPAQIIV